MALTVAVKLKRDAEYQNQVESAISQAVDQAEQEIDAYLLNHPGLQVPKTRIKVCNTAKCDTKALIFGHWPEMFQELTQRYSEWTLAEGPEYLIFAPKVW